jgi:hypothetical protein
MNLYEYIQTFRLSYKQEVTIADFSSPMCLTLWEKDTLEEFLAPTRESIQRPEIPNHTKRRLQN